MATPEMQDGEEIVNHWTLNFRPTAGGRYTGKFFITNQRVIFDAAHDNSSLLSALSDRSFGSHGILSVDLGDVKEVVSEKKMFRKSVILHVAGEQLRFDYGMLSVDKLVDTLKEQLGRIA
jgi:hypothetical protein